MIGITIDYLIINGLQKKQIDLDDYRVLFPDGSIKFSGRNELYGTKVFRTVTKIYFNGNEFATLTSSPHENSIHQDGFCQIQFNNRFLYESLRYFKAIVKDFFNEYSIEPTGLNRLDIALDSQINSGGFNPVLFEIQKHLADNSCIIVGKEKILTFNTSTKANFTGFTLGLRSSDRYLRFYNKSAEMQAKQTKKHIVTWWKNTCNFWNEKNDVWRLEMQLNRRFLKDITDVFRIFDYSFLSSMFQISIEKFFDLRENLNYSREYRNPKIQIYNKEFLKEYIKTSIYSRTTERVGKGQFYMPIRKNSPVEDQTINQNKQTIKKMFFRYLKSNQESILPVFFIREIFEINPSYYELEFFSKKRSYWIAEFCSKCGGAFRFDAQKFQFDLEFVKDLDN